MNIKKLLLKVKVIKILVKGSNLINDPIFSDTERKTNLEISKSPLRSEIINFLLSLNQNDTIYLEIGTRNPKSNFDLINATTKYSVDPGIEFKKNPVDFKMTSDVFFQKLDADEILSNDIKFDVIFIDGLHLADQVDRDIKNALNYIKDDGFIVLHDCNPPTEWHARETYRFNQTPANRFWNGTTWKAFLKWRFSSLVNSCCIDSDWGVGILSKTHKIGENMEPTNPFFEFKLLESNKQEYLNLIDFETFKSTLNNK